MTALESPSSASAIAASRSLLSVAATVVLAAITHAYDFGPAAFVAGAVVLGMLFTLNRHYRRVGSRLAIVLYGLLSLWVIVGFGLVGGVWNHAVRDVLSTANGGTLSTAIQPLFMSPELGSAVYETFWILLGAAALLAAYFTYRLARVVPWSPRASVATRSRSA